MFGIPIAPTYCQRWKNCWFLPRPLVEQAPFGNMAMENHPWMFQRSGKHRRLQIHTQTIEACDGEMNVTVTFSLMEGGLIRVLCALARQRPTVTGQWPHYR